MFKYKETVPYLVKKKLASEVLSENFLDKVNQNQLRAIFDIFKCSGIAGSNMSASKIKEQVGTWLVEKFEGFKSIESFINTKRVKDEEVKKYAIKLIKCFKSKLDDWIESQNNRKEKSEQLVRHGQHKSQRKQGFDIKDLQNLEGSKNQSSYEMNQMNPSHQGFPFSNPYHMMGPPQMMSPNYMYPHFQSTPIYNQYYSQNKQHGMIGNYPPFYPPPQLPAFQAQMNLHTPPHPEMKNRVEEKKNMPNTKTTNKNSIQLPKMKTIHPKKLVLDSKSLEKKGKQQPPVFLICDQNDEPSKKVVEFHEKELKIQKNKEVQIVNTIPEERPQQSGPQSNKLTEGRNQGQRHFPPMPGQNITRPPPRGLQQVFNSELRKCLCSGDRVYDENIFTCQSCSNKFHFSCLQKVTGNLLCSCCFMRVIDPLTPVVDVIREDRISFLHTLEDISVEFDVQRAMKQMEQFQKRESAQYEIQIRCMKLVDGANGVSEFCWPDETTLYFEKEIVCSFNAVQYNSCLKKRKDGQVILTKYALAHNSYQKQKKVRLTLLHHNLSMEEYNKKKIQNAAHFVLGLYIVKKLNVSSLCEKVVNQKINRVKYIQKYFFDQEKNKQDVMISKFKVSLLDPYSWNLIDIPSRGNNCDHPQCFDLWTYIKFESEQPIRYWRCSICKRSCQHFVIDQQMQEVLRVFKKQIKPIESKEYCFLVVFPADGRTIYLDDSHFIYHEIHQREKEDEEFDDQRMEEEMSEQNQ